MKLILRLIRCLPKFDYCHKTLSTNDVWYIWFKKNGSALFLSICFHLYEISKYFDKFDFLMNYCPQIY